MIVPQQELFAVLRNFNPWWDRRPDVEVPTWRRVAFGELSEWLTSPPSHRAVLLSGARRVGKTTLLRQAIESLRQEGISPDNILYATFDSPILKLIGLEGLLRVWEELRTDKGGIEYLFLDEIQYTKDWQTWLKHQVDFQPRRRIVVTGSAIPITAESPESGVGRWHTIKLPTLSFFEYLQIREAQLPTIPHVDSLTKTIGWTDVERGMAAESGRVLIPHFHQYLLRGGFPETARIEDITVAQRLLREDIVDKVLKRDMTALFGTRSVLDLEKAFLYLCLHDGGILDMPTFCSNLGITKPTAKHFFELFEAAHLVYKLAPHGYGKEILRGRYKFYLADAAIAGSVLLKGNALLEDSARLGAAVETAFFKHVFTRYYPVSIGFSYWRDTRTKEEVDVIAEIQGDLVPFEVKYSDAVVGAGDVKGLRKFCELRSIERGYVLTKNSSDFGVLPLPDSRATILKIPAPLACYWLSRSEGR